jgi:hypothetical protein
MVVGALEGAIEGACGVQAEVTWNGSGVDSNFGKFCQYRIVSKFTIPDTHAEIHNIKVTK